jgi:FkbM family methyltransferase
MWSLFQEKNYSGTFIDIGALDGIHFSNTYSFELAGWTGVCIEAHPTFTDYLKKNRPNSIVVHAAAADQDKSAVTFYANRRGSLSTLDLSMEPIFRKKFPNFKGYKEIQVPMVKLNTILSKHDIQKVDIVSIDVEGTELRVLYGFDLNKYEPRVLVIEACTDSHFTALLDYMKSKKYIYSGKIGRNYFFCKTQKDSVRITKHIRKNRRTPNKKLIRQVLPLSHPLHPSNVD